MIRNLLYILLLALLLSCKNDSPVTEKKQDVTPSRVDDDNSSSSSTSSNNYNDETDDVDDETSTEFEDDTYSADVEYYNPNTGTRRNYTLDVEVQNNTVIVIRFSNGGWIDETHITSGGELDEDGTTTLFTDDGREFTITINR